MSDLGKSRLIALGTAAVVAVYAAGFDRTRAAAQQFGGDDIQRRAPVRPLARASTGVSVAPTEAPPPPLAVRGGPTAVHANPTTSIVAASAAPVSAAPIAGATDSATIVAPPAKAADSTTATATTRGADAAEPPHALMAQWKDGSYTGWGTSRHGDIQATVVIAEGHIVAAQITQCLTRYSCSWIAALPPQVVSRQSPEVDYVSGATQSTNAFYTAVVEALSKAK